MSWLVDRIARMDDEELRYDQQSCYTILNGGPNRIGLKEVLVSGVYSNKNLPDHVKDWEQYLDLLDVEIVKRELLS